MRAGGSIYCLLFESKSEQQKKYIYSLGSQKKRAFPEVFVETQFKFISLCIYKPPFIVHILQAFNVICNIQLFTTKGRHKWDVL